MSVTGGVPPTCCCDPPGEAIEIDSFYEAAVNYMYEERFRGFHECSSQRGHCVPPCNGDSTISTALEWNCGFTYYGNDFIRDPQQWKVPTSWICVPCGVQGVGNCGQSIDNDGVTCIGNCGATGENEAARYVGWQCRYPGSWYAWRCLGGCSCGCSGYSGDGSGPLCCPEGNPCCGCEQPCSCMSLYYNCACMPECAQTMCEWTSGARLSGWWPGSYGWKVKSHIKRAAVYRFEFAERTTTTESRTFSNIVGCNGVTQSLSLDVAAPTDVYLAPDAGFPGQRTKGSLCQCYACWDTREGPSLGIDGFGRCEAYGSQFVKFMHQPVIAVNYGFMVKKNSLGCNVNDTWEMAATGGTLTIYKNNVVQATISLNDKTAAQVQLAVQAVAPACISVPGTQTPKWPGHLCVGPVVSVARTAITTSGVPVYKQGYQSGDPLDTTIFGVQSEYRFCTYSELEQQQTEATDAACDTYPLGGPHPAGSLWSGLRSYRYVSTAGTYEQWQRGFDAYLPSTGCFMLEDPCTPNQAAQECCLRPAPWPFRSWPNVRPKGFYFGPEVTIQNQMSESDESPARYKFDCFCCSNESRCSCPYPIVPDTDPTEHPNNAWNIPCPWDGTEANKQYVRPVDNAAVEEYLYSDLGCCNNRTECDSHTNLDCTGNMVSDACCDEDSPCPGCPVRGTGGSIYSNAVCAAAGFPRFCHSFGRCNACDDPSSPIYDPNGCKFVCCCGCYKGWYRKMRTANWSCTPAVTMGHRFRWTLRRIIPQQGG